MVRFGGFFEALREGSLRIRIQDYVSYRLMDFVHVDAPFAQVGDSVHLQGCDVLHIQIAARNHYDGYGLMFRMILELADEIEAAQPVEGQIHDNRGGFFPIHPLKEVFLEREKDAFEPLILHDEFHELRKTGAIFDDKDCFLLHDLRD